MKEFQFDIIIENQYFAVLNKAAGLQVEPDKMGHPNLLENFKLYLSQKGIVHWGPNLPHRLDRPTSGLVVISKQKKAHQSLQAQWENREVEKFYLAEVEGIVKPTQTKLEHYLFKDVKNFKALISDTPKPDYKKCSLEYELVYQKENFTVLKIKLLTGRYHQIRAQLSHIGHPIVGDMFYGAKFSIGESKILLHAYKLTFKAPPTNEWITVEQLPDWAL